MNRNEFMDYCGYLKNLFPHADIPIKPMAGTDKKEYMDKLKNWSEKINAWYKPFESVELDQAKKMADDYIQHEAQYFNFARLVAYKDKYCRSKYQFTEDSAEYQKNIDMSCKVCGGIGAVEVEKLIGDLFYSFTYRCVCSTARNFSSNIRTVTKNDLKGHIKKYKNVYIIKEE